MPEEGTDGDDPPLTKVELVSTYTEHLRLAQALLDADVVTTETYHDGKTWVVSYEYHLSDGLPDMTVASTVDAARARRLLGSVLPSNHSLLEQYDDYSDDPPRGE